MAVGTVLASSAPDLRLIETAPGVRSWMSEVQIEELSTRIHKEGRCGGFFDVTDHVDEPDLSELLGIGIPGPREIIAERPLTQANRLERVFPEISTQNLYSSIKTLSDFPDRYFKSSSGVASSNWISDQFTRFAHGRTDITVETYKHAFAQSSVIARIAGRGPNAAEHIILGGHADSTSNGVGAGRRAPGADDNASGIATLLETFRILSESGWQPDRTIDFIAYAAEEAGLRGSQDIAQDYKRRGVDVLAVIQFDMTAFMGKTPVMGLVSDNVNPGLNTFQKRLLDTYVKYSWREIRCGYGCSDHASWTRAGFASVFPFESLFEEYNPSIHSEADTIDKLNMAFGSHFVKLALAFAMELGTEP